MLICCGIDLLIRSFVDTKGSLRLKGYKGFKGLEGWRVLGLEGFRVGGQYKQYHSYFMKPLWLSRKLHFSSCDIPFVES